jgi:hypothetical protein
MAICVDNTTRPATTRLRVAVEFEGVDRRTPATGARTARHRGTRPNVNAARTEIVSVKRKTVASGLRPVSIPGHGARSRVAEIANSHPKSAPAPTNKRLSHSNCRKIVPRLAPIAIRRLNSCSRKVLRGLHHRGHIGASNEEHKTHKTHQDPHRCAIFLVISNDAAGRDKSK